MIAGFCVEKTFSLFLKKKYFLRIHVSLCYKTHQTIHLEKNFWFWNIFVFVESVTGCMIAGFCVEKNSAPASEKKFFFFKNSKFYRNVTETPQNP